MEVMISTTHNLDFDFSSSSAMSSPHVSPPSTPKRLGNYYFSAPSSPSRLSQLIYHDFYTDSGGGSAEFTGDSSSAVPFELEEKPKSEASKNNNEDMDHDFAFNVSEDFGTGSLSAEELFDGGVIKPLKPPPQPENSPEKKPASISRKIVQNAFSHNSKTGKDQRRGKKTVVTFSNEFITEEEEVVAGSRNRVERGRERGVNLPKSSNQRAARSLSPLREYNTTLKDEEENNNAKNSSPATTHKKWSLKDFFLFRSASEGRAADKDPLKKYTAAVRAMDSSGSGSGSRRRTGPLSAHEMHYKANRAVSEDLKKKTFLPYKQGILGGWRSFLPSKTPSVSR